MLIPMAFKIPTSFWLYGQKIHVTMVPDLIERENATGQSLYRRDVVEIQANSTSINRPRSHIEVTFLHELLHMIFYVMGEDDMRNNESMIDEMAKLLHQAFITAEGDA